MSVFVSTRVVLLEIWSRVLLLVVWSCLWDFWGHVFGSFGRHMIDTLGSRVGLCDRQCWKFCVVDMSNISVTLWDGVLGQLVSVVDLKFCELIRSATWSANEIWRLSIATINAPLFRLLVWIDSHCLSDECGEHCELVVYLRWSIERCTIGGRSSSRMHERCSVDICEFFSTLWMWFVYKNDLRVIWYLRISY